MKISAHNQLQGTISDIRLGEVAAEIVLSISSIPFRVSEQSERGKKHVLARV